MKGLREIKSIIFKTDCADCIYEGLHRSEPIITKDEKGLIDNYFIYARNDEASKFSKPMLAFGIYSDLEKTAYKKYNLDFEDKVYCLSDGTRKPEFDDAYDRYTELYPQVRVCAYFECSDEQKMIVREYLKSLETISGSVLWGFYQKLWPSFFEWAQRQIGDR